MVKSLRLLFQRSVLLCLTVFVCCFLIGLIVFFPLERWAGYVENLVRQQGVELEIVEPELAFPLTAQARRLVVSSRSVPHPPIHINTLEISPLWAELISGHAAVDYSFSLFSGMVRGEAYADGAVEVAFNGLEIDEALQLNIPLRVIGSAVEGSVSGIVPYRNGRGRAEGRLSGLAVAGLQAIGATRDSLELGTLTCNLESTGSNIKVKQLEIAAPQFRLTGSGTLRLKPNSAKSLINMTLTIEPADDFDPVLLDMLKLVAKKQKDGSLQLRLRGPLDGLRLN